MHRRGAQSLVDFRLTISAGQKCATLSSVSRYQSSVPRRPRPSPPKAERKQINKWTDIIVDAAARGPSHSWKHPKSLRGEEKRLIAAVRTGQKRARAHSLEKARFDASLNSDDADLEWASTSALNIEPGTFIELRRSDHALQGVVLEENFRNRSWFTTTLISSGEVWTHHREDVMFTIPGFVSKDLVARCGASELASRESENMARVEVLKRVRDFENLIERHNIVGRLGHNVYEQLKSPDPAKWSKVTVAEVVKLSRQQPSSPLLSTFMVHKHLMDHSKYFVADPVSYRATQTYHLRPESHVKAIDAVLAMSRSGDSYLDVFSSKAKLIIQANRRRALKTWHEPPSIGDKDALAFTSDDATIINFLLHSILPTRMIQANPYGVLVASIVKKIGLYPGAVDGGLVHRVLIDLGVIAPWHDISLLTKEAVDGTREAGRATQPIRRDARIQVRSVPPGSQAAKGPLGPEDLHPNDLMESLRHDFGDMPVYVIDDVGAEELDDGLSIERLPGEPGSTWIHVHIADPTAILPPTHIAAMKAREQLETSYMIHGSTPMLPSSLLAKASLGTASTFGQPERVLTFSVKIDRDGNISDYKVRAGLIRNVRTLTYDAVDQAMGRWAQSVKFPFGGMSSPPPTVHLDPSQLQDLWALDEAAQRLVDSRLKLPIFSYNTEKASVSFMQKPVPSSPVDSTKSKTFNGFPRLTYFVQSFSDFDRGSRRIVSEFMKAACRIASRFCLERGLPALRRASTEIIVPSDSAFTDLLATRDSHGMVDYLSLLATGALTPQTQYTLAPAMHWALGVPEGEGYVRVTSPLRRYNDMMVHWQIKHALLNPKAPPLFSEEWLRDFAKEMTVKEAAHKRINRLDGRFWALLFIQRWIEDPRGHGAGRNPLLDMVGHVLADPVLNVQRNSHQCKVTIPELGLQGILRDIPKEAILIGDELKVKVADIRLGSAPLLVLDRR